MADILDWRLRSGHRLVIERTLQQLGRGDLVALPTDTTYCIAADVLNAEAVARLARLAGDAAPLSVALPSAGCALDWAPQMSRLGRRLARRCWPGPLRLVLGEGLQDGLAWQLAEPVRQRLTSGGTLSLYVPGHDALAGPLLLLPAPLVVAPISRAGNGEAASAEQVQEGLGAEVSLIVDDGPSRCDKPLSAVRLDGPGWTMLHEGAISAEQITQQTTCVILFVCTGNTCRSPLAEALCSKLLAERLGCAPGELLQRGYLVLSAGVAAMPGDPASPEAVAAAEELGGDLSRHSSQPLTAELVLQADYLITMTRGHQSALTARFARAGVHPRLLDPAGGDIADPVGADKEVYRDCARQIHEYLEKFLTELGLATRP